MDGFKNTTKTRYDTGNGYAMGGSVKGAAKVAKVMGEFKGGKLHSGSKDGPKVTSPKQATAIAMSEARKAGAKMPVQEKGLGGILSAISPLAAIASGKPKNLLTAFGGLTGLALSQLLKKKKSGVPLTPVDEKKLVESGEDTTGTPAGPPMPPAAAKHGGMMKKKGVPVAPRGPLVGLSVMPRGKK
jgi:hypothetical protein